MSLRKVGIPHFSFMMGEAWASPNAAQLRGSMKSEFLLAFKQICSDRNLPPEIVLDALKSALVSAYRRNTGASSAQNVVAEIEQTTGEATIYAEKEIVETVQDDRTEVSLEEAKQVKSEIELGDLVMVESTPQDFGRIAAQTAKQVILQRIREAERDALYEDYIGREGEVINGTVQSITSQHISINLGRTEAILPRKEQVPGERYTMHQRLRAYVLEVKRTTRGPQIIVSRSHRDMLRRMLELEVPEIYNGAVEIKSIAREAGARSKVAVTATKPGVDPVGSCVGMRGVRIQSIVNELGGEKIDVIEWSPSSEEFIAKALSPAKVLSVHLEESPESGRTAVVIVPDDQLSLAIGREGQNARLAAKLTGWRIDIKGITESAEELIAQWQELDLEPSPLDNLIPTAIAVLQRHKEIQTSYTTEETLLLRQIVDGIHKQILAQKQAEPEAEPEAPVDTVDAERQAALADIPDQAYELLLEDMDLSTRVRNHLAKSDVETVGQIMERLVDGDEGLLALDGIGPKSLSEIKEKLEALPLAKPEPEPVEVVAEKEIDEAAPKEPEEKEAVAEPPVEPMVEPDTVEPELVEKPEPEEEPAEEPEEEPAEEPVEEPAEEPVEEPAEAEPEIKIGEVIEIAEPEEEEEEKEEDGELVIYYYDEEKPELEDDIEPDTKPKRTKHKRRRLIYDEELGEVVAKRRRKRSRREGWEDLID